MKISDIDTAAMCQQCRLILEDLEEDEKNYLDMLKEAAIAYAANYTGLSEEKLDDLADITIAVLTLISDMYDNRQMQVDKSNANKVITTILDMHSVNLLPQ